MNYDEIYMYVVDGAVYVGTKWALKNIGAEKVLDQTIDEAGKAVGVKLAGKKKNKYFNDGLMFVASKWLYKNYLYSMLRDLMKGRQLIQMEELRNALGISATITLMRAFQGKASLKGFMEDALAVGASQMVNRYIKDYIPKPQGNDAFVMKQQETAKPQSMAVIQEPCQTVQNSQKRVLLC